MKPLKLGIAGLGTVAQGVLQGLRENGALINARAGREIVVSRVASRTPKDIDLLGATFSTDLADLCGDDVDVVLELIGSEAPALALMTQALARGKSVVTANKAVIASHGDALLQEADKQGSVVRFEAAVAGAIPIVAVVRDSLAGNRVTGIVGIINGTSNFILTAMAEQGAEFAAALAQAQELGYAEADPTFDVEGIDAAHKLAILVALAFDRPFTLEGLYTEGISRVTPADMRYARQLGYRIKHLGIARLNKAGVEVRVHPTLVPETALLAKIDGVMNAVMVEASAAGATLYSGPGAGMLPTSSAVLADVVDVARGLRVPSADNEYAPRRVAADAPPVVPMAQVSSSYYLRLLAHDRPGVFARIATVLGEHDISIESAIQREDDVRDGRVPVVILTHSTTEGTLTTAIAGLEALADIEGPVVRLRVEHFADA